MRPPSVGPSITVKKKDNKMNKRDRECVCACVRVRVCVWAVCVFVYVCLYLVSRLVVSYRVACVRVCLFMTYWYQTLSLSGHVVGL